MGEGVEGVWRVLGIWLSDIGGGSRVERVWTFLGILLLGIGGGGGRGSRERTGEIYMAVGYRRWGGGIWSIVGIWLSGIGGGEGGRKKRRRIWGGEE